MSDQQELSSPRDRLMHAVGMIGLKTKVRRYTCERVETHIQPSFKPMPPHCQEECEEVLLSPSDGSWSPVEEEKTRQSAARSLFCYGPHATAEPSVCSQRRSDSECADDKPETQVMKTHATCSSLPRFHSS